MNGSLQIFFISFFLMTWALPSSAVITKSEMLGLFDVFSQVQKAELQAKNEELHINRSPPNLDYLEIPLVSASYVQYRKDGKLHHDISLFGGILKLDDFDLDGAALLMCHEMGHAWGGPPFKAVEVGQESRSVSVEGQADDYATRVCLPKIWALLKEPDSSPSFPLAEQRCGQAFQNSEAIHHCIRSFRAMKSFQTFVQKTMKQSADFEAQDPTRVDHVELRDDFYPSAQCRLETLMQGALQAARPSCWFHQDLP